MVALGERQRLGEVGGGAVGTPLETSGNHKTIKKKDLQGEFWGNGRKHSGVGMSIKGGTLNPKPDFSENLKKIKVGGGVKGEGPAAGVGAAEGEQCSLCLQHGGSGVVQGRANEHRGGVKGEGL